MDYQVLPSAPTMEGEHNDTDLEVNKNSFDDDCIVKK